MKSISKLKDEARRYEQREEWEKAIQTYLQVLRAAEDDEAEVDLPLYNRLGDLCVRLGRPEEAVRHYEHAADRYAEVGLFNNAIALCNKALRYDRDRPELIRKLGQFSASQGFVTDARRYFLDYAERQFNAGRVDDALTALEDFADVADDPEVRELLGRRLQAHGRTDAAVKELQRAYAMRTQAGDTARAEALLAELQAMDPHAASSADVSAPAPAAPSRTTPVADELPVMTEKPADFEVASFEDPGTAQIEGLEPGEVEPPADVTSDAIEGLETPEPAADFIIDTSGIEGLERGTVDFSAVEPLAEDPGILRDATSFGDTIVPDAAASSGESFDLPLLDDEPVEEPADDLPLLDDEPDGEPADELPLLEAGPAVDDLPLLDDAPLVRPPRDLPLLDDEPPLDDLPLLSDEPEATPASKPQIDDALAPIDLGADFSFDLGGFRAPEPPAEVPPVAGESLAPTGPGADDDGIALPDVDDDAGFEFDVADPVVPVPADAEDTFDLPGLEDDDLPASAVFGGAEDAPAEPTFDGLSELEAEPPAWEPEPAPTFELPPFEPEPSGYEEILADVGERVGETGDAFEIPDLPDLPELADDAESGPPLPLLDEPTAAAPPDEPEASVEIPAIELPTWDTDPAPTADADVAVPDVAPPSFAETPPIPAPPGHETPADWLEDEADELAGADALAPEPAGEVEQPAAREEAGAGPTHVEEPRRDVAAAPPAADDAGFVDLGALVTDDEEEHTTRFRIRETAPTGDEDQDFAELLSQFKAKVNQHLPLEDASAHYDLGLAFKEMGLLDEAIGEFQVALRAGHMRLRVYEELGECFLMKEQYNIAEKVLTRALAMKYDDELELLGVYYHLGRAYEALGRKESAREAYERVLGMDINFEDVTARLARL